MRTIILFRHGKSDWGAGAREDHARPLNERGRRSAAVMGEFLARAGQVPERLLTSSALRARTTLEIAREAGAWEGAAEALDELYDTTAERVLALLRAVDGGPRSILLTGHQPTWSDLVSAFCQGARVRFPTGAMARVDLAIGDWSGLGFGSGELVWLVPPKTLTAERFRFAE